MRAAAATVSRFIALTSLCATHVAIKGASIVSAPRRKSKMVTSASLSVHRPIEQRAHSASDVWRSQPAPDDCHGGSFSSRPSSSSPTMPTRVDRAVQTEPVGEGSPSRAGHVSGHHDDPVTDAVIKGAGDGYAHSDSHAPRHLITLAELRAGAVAYARRSDQKRPACKRFQAARDVARFADRCPARMSASQKLFDYRCALAGAPFLPIDSAKRHEFVLSRYLTKHLVCSPRASAVIGVPEIDL